MLGSTDRRTFLKLVGAGTAALATTRLGTAASGPRPRIHRVHHIPAPDFASSNRHPGLESLLFSMAADGIRFYQGTTPHPLSGPDGLIAADDTVLIKVNAQWKYRGCSNSDVTRGVVQRILDHPDGFTGEVVIIENGQGRGSLNCDTTSGCDGGTREVHANAENEGHSFSWLVQQLFQDERVGERLLDGIRTTFITADDHDTEGYRTLSNVSYPCFFTPRGTRVEFKEGLWNGTSHDSQRLKWINIPTMKDHKDLNVTGCLKNIYGLITTYNEPIPHHDPNQGGKVMGEFFTLVRPATLNLLDHIWVSHASLCGFPPDTTTRRNMLVAGFDPCALDAWSARHVLYPISGDPAHDPDIPGYFRSYLLDARDTINGNGGIFGEDSTIDEAAVIARHQDQRKIQLALARRGDDIYLEWAGAAAPYRLERDSSPDFLTAQILADNLTTTEYTDLGAGVDGTNWYYRVSAV
ncbi:MAG: DUF362 domain-containing protein [Acidobacteriota bacterium]|nr:DUF362 domain-containing protein [Acidobacteriota bacterium]MDQ7087240.1 DUF362 domain-containing protein [Acidobacteriota bacterium]